MTDAFGNHGDVRNQSREGVTNPSSGPNTTERHSLKRKITEEVAVVKPSYVSLGIQTESDQLVEKLSCSVCWIWPRDLELYTCDNGHLICGVCWTSIKERKSEDHSCPMCRDRNLTKNKFAESILRIAQESYPVNCQFDSNGCTERGLTRYIVEHEDGCKKRIVCCPSVHKATCKWQGTWEKNLFTHLNVKDSRCVQTIQPIQIGSRFKSSIVDFPQEDNTVFKSTGITHWLPVMVVLKIGTSFECVYLCIAREKEGFWTLTPRTYAPKKIQTRLRVAIVVCSPKDKEESPANQKSTPLFSYSGKVCTHKMTNSDVSKSGQYLRLTDQQVLSMVQGKSLFSYSFSVDVILNDE